MELCLCLNTFLHCHFNYTVLNPSTSATISEITLDLLLCKRPPLVQLHFIQSCSLVVWEVAPRMSLSWWKLGKGGWFFSVTSLRQYEYTVIFSNSVQKFSSMSMVETRGKNIDEKQHRGEQKDFQAHFKWLGFVLF